MGKLTGMVHRNQDKKTLPHLERKLRNIYLLTVCPILLMFLALLFTGDYSILVVLTLLPIAFISVLGGLIYLHKTLQKQFFGVANVIECLRNGDFTMRVSPQDMESAWGEVNHELNRLAVSLNNQRMNAVESEIILEKLIEEFDVPLLVTERGGALRYINRAGAELFTKERRELIGLSIKQLHLSTLFAAKTGTVIEYQFPNRGGKWEIRRNIIRQHGSRYNLLLLNDLSRALREEERQAWQKIVRVLGHELNNSMASITSVAETMSGRADVNADPVLSKGLSVIVERGHGLQRFTEAYTSLAKLPQPKSDLISVNAVVERVVTLLGGNIQLLGELDVTLNADPDQLEQLLLNLAKNALESGSPKPVVQICIVREVNGVVIEIKDNGQGIANPDNLFVPFYTTKKSGNGIGLYLCRQISEAHKGVLTLENNQGESGCTARIWLPLRHPNNRVLSDEALP